MLIENTGLPARSNAAPSDRARELHEQPLLEIHVQLL